MGIKGLAKLLSDEAPDSIRDVELKSLYGRKIAIDASMAIYQFLIAVRSGGNNQAAVMLTNDAGETTSHIQGMFNRTIRYMTEGIKPVFVFDGKPPELKSGELQKRRDKRQQAQKALETATESGDVAEQDKHAKRLVRAGHKENLDCQRLLQLMGVPVVLAPCEAEAQAAALAKAGVVYAAATEDMDALTFAAPTLLRKMTFAGSAKNVVIQSINYDKALTGLGVTHEQFVDLCILLGCDYCDTIRGVGPKTALKLILEHKTIEAILPLVLKNSKYVVPKAWLPPEERKEDEKDETKKKQDDDEEDDNDSREPDTDQEEGEGKQDKEEDKKGSPKKDDDDDDGDNEDNKDENAPFVPAYILARKMFQEHEILESKDVSIKWKPCQADELKKFLVDEMGFNGDRVSSSIEKLQAAYKANQKPQARMDSFFAVKPSTGTATKKRKPAPEPAKKNGKKKGAATKKKR